MLPESHEGIQILSSELITRLHEHRTKVWIYTIDEPDPPAARAMQQCSAAINSPERSRCRKIG